MTKSKGNSIPGTLLVVIIAIITPLLAYYDRQQSPCNGTPHTLAQPTGTLYVNKLLLQANLFAINRNKMLNTSRKLPMLYLCVLLIAHSADTETNPGPRTPKYPCQICDKAVRANQKGVACDHCSTWLHKACIGMTTQEYSRLANNSSIMWICNKCEGQNHSTSLFVSALADESTNIYSSLVESVSIINPDSRESADDVSLAEEIGSPIAASSPNAMRTPTPQPKRRRGLNSSDDIKVLVMNCQSIKHKREELLTTIESADPDVMMFTETWLHQNIKNNEFLPDHYETHRRDRPGDPHGGVLLAIKKDLNSQDVNWPTDANCDIPDTEMVFAKISNKKIGNILIGCCYRPPSSDINYANSMSSSIRSLLNKCPTATAWIGGDFNLPDIQWKENQITSHQNTKSINEAFMNTFQDLSVKQLVDFPTRKENILDLFLTNRPSLVNRLEPMPGISDHDTMIYVNTNVKPYRQPPVKRNILLWKKADIDNIRSMADTLSDRITSQYTTHTPVNTIWQELKSGVENVLKTIPSKMTSSRFQPPWVNRTIKRNARRKQRAHRKACNSNRPQDWSRLRKLVKNQRVECRNAYYNYIRDIISPDLHQRPKRFWSYISSRKCDNNGVAPLRNTDGLIYSDAKSKADILNNQFSSVFTQEPKDNLPDLGISTHPEMTPITINEAGVRKLLQNIKPHKAAGPDNIPARILREATNNLAPAMTILFQASIDQGTLPDDWKTANVAPIFKKGDRCKAANYHPVSLTCISCKLMEHVISSSMMRHLDDNGILTDTQHGFRKHRSCESQLISTIHDLAKGIEDRKQTDVVLLDFSKAFDKVPHLRLLQKLDHYGIRGDTRRWIAQFLQGRDQKVLLNGQHSTSAPVHSRRPTGHSAWAHTIFSIH